MIISEKNIENYLDYLNNLSDKKYEALIDKIVDEQAYLSTFVQQNLDNIFKDNTDIKDFTFNIYTNVIYFFKSKLGSNYKIVNNKILSDVLNSQNYEHKQEFIGDFIYNQIINKEINKNETFDILNILAIVINSLS